MLSRAQHRQTPPISADRGPTCTPLRRSDAEQATPVDAAEHGQSRYDLQDACEKGPVVAEQDAEHAAPVNADTHDQWQHDLRTELANLSDNSHSQCNAAGEASPALVDDGQDETPLAPELGDSLQFKNEMAAFNHPDSVDMAEVGHGPAWYAHGHYGAGNDGPAAIHDPESAAYLLTDQHAADHAAGARCHVMHDLFV